MVDALVSAGSDVYSATRRCPGAADEELVARAQSEGRVIITFDKGYGELVYRRRLVLPGVVLLRILPRSPEYILDRLQRLLASPAGLSGRFTVLSDTSTRSLPLPRS